MTIVFIFKITRVQQAHYLMVPQSASTKKEPVNQIKAFAPSAVTCESATGCEITRL